MAFDMGNAAADFGSGCSNIEGHCLCWVAASVSQGICPSELAGTGMPRVATKFGGYMRGGM